MRARPVSGVCLACAGRSAGMLAASLVFLELLAHSAVALLPLPAFLALGFACIRLLASGRTRSVAFFVAIVILAYAGPKKYAFLPESSFLSHPYFTLGPLDNFLCTLHLVIESGDGAEQGPLSVTRYLLHTRNFTTLVAGPIHSYDDFAHDRSITHRVTHFA